MTTETISIRAASHTYKFAPIAEPGFALTTKQAENAAEHRCTFVLRMEGRRPVALVEEAETAGYVCHTLGATNGHGGGDLGSVTLGLTRIGPAEMVVRAPDAPRAATPAPAPRPGPIVTVTPTATTPAGLQVATATIAPAARQMPTAPVVFASGSRVCLTAATLATTGSDGRPHAERTGHVATVLSCQPSRTRHGEYSVKIRWDAGIPGHHGTETQNWWAGHFQPAAAGPAMTATAAMDAEFEEEEEEEEVDE